MEEQRVTHQNIGQRYRLVIERAASTKGVNGYKVEVNGDDRTQVVLDMEYLKADAEKLAGPAVATEAK